MVSVVNDACVKCKSCVDVCPVDAFHEGETQLVIDPDTLLPVCPKHIKTRIKATEFRITK